METSPPPGTGDLLALFLLAIRSFRSPRTVKSVIIHICATEGNCTYVCMYVSVRHVPRYSFTNLPEERLPEGRREERNTTGRRLIVGDTRAAVKDDMETDRETLRPVTLDIVFWILMAFTGVSG